MPRVILIDTHIWIWWITDEARISAQHSQLIRDRLADGVGVSVISIWEIANLVRLGRLELTMPVGHWVGRALAIPGVRLLDLTPRVAIEASELPGDFHRDPADRLIVATARIHDCLLLTADAKILAYPHVKTL